MGHITKPKDHKHVMRYLRRRRGSMTWVCLRCGGAIFVKTEAFRSSLLGIRKRHLNTKRTSGYIPDYLDLVMVRNV